jgi:hypothetical protein
MTGQGILANTIIVNTLYALATDDGFTKLEASGLHVYDDLARERLIAGWWMDGVTKRFGLNVKAQDGATTLLDDRGLLQTWQEGYPDNCDPSHPFVFDIYLPATVRVIQIAKLRFRLQKFRAYETGAASGGGDTSGPSSELTTGSSEGLWFSSPGFTSGFSVTSIDGDHSHNTNIDGYHVHTLYAHNHTDSVGGGTSYNKDGIDTAGEHDHTTNTGGGHTHALVDVDHSHGMSHTHTIPDHVHDLNFGIYEGTTPANVTIKINGIDCTAALGGPFNADQTDLNIAPYLVTGQFNTIELGTSRMGRIHATYFVQVLMSAVE